MKPIGRRRRAWMWLASALAVLVLAEIACRIDAFFPRAPYDRHNAKKHFTQRAVAGPDQILSTFAAPDPAGSESSVRPFPHPYFGWFTERNARVLEEQGRWFSGTESTQTFDVIVLGGSVAADFTNRAGVALERLLAADPKLASKPVRVWNDAHAAFKAPQTGNLLTWLFALGHRPDAVILIDGFNELAIGMTNARANSHPLMPSFEFWGGLARGKVVDEHSLDLLLAVHTANQSEQSVAGTAVSWGFYNSALLTRITLARLASRHRAFNAALARYQEYTRPRLDEYAVSGVTFDPAPEAVVATAVRGWSENARLVRALCREHAIPLLHLLQPTSYDTGSKPLTREEKLAANSPSAWRDGVQGGYGLLRKAALDLSAEDCPIHDATRLFEHRPEQTFVDVCHLNELGISLLTERVAQELLRTLP
ncbi:MAG: hypothetical protein JNL28_15955 [Planctomycetes bacterium]|nr:hypothetical protein [Planctomycetota bacterium]